MYPPLQDKLFDLLEAGSPSNWTFDECTAKHASGVTIWTGNAPYADLSVWKPCETARVKGWLNRRRMRRLLADMRAKKIMEALRKAHL